MALHGQGQGDVRRRRVLLDSTSSHDDLEQRRRSSPRRHRRAYADDALKENQLRLCDLITKAWWTILLFLLLLPAGMLFGIFQGYQHFHHQEDAVAATFALSGSGNISSWFASLLLLSVMIGSLQVYLLRRHKLDDYRGRYKVWLVVAAWSAIASLDASSGLHRLLDLAARHVPASGMLATADGWWLLVASGLTGVLGLRLLVEIRRSVISLIFMSVALMGYSGLLAVQLGWISLPGAIDASLVGAMILLGSHISVCASIWIFARACFFSAQRFGRRRRHDSAHSQAGSHQLPHGERSMAEDMDEEESWVEDEQEEERLDVSAEGEEKMDEDVLEDDEDVAVDDYEEESFEEYEEEESDNSWGQSAYDDPYREKEEASPEYDSGLTSEEKRLIAEGDKEVQSQDVGSKREAEVARMQADDEQYSEGMDPGQWRKMTKRQRKKWRRRQRRAA